MRTAELLRDEAEVLDVVVDTALAGRDRIARRATCAALPPRARAARACGASPSRRPASSAPARPAALEEVLALGDGALDLGDGARAVVDGGVLRCERTPPLPAHRT